MESLLLSLRVVGPLFLMMAIGYVLRLLHMLDRETVSKMSAVTFRVFLSTQIFSNIYSCGLAEVWDGRVVLMGFALTAANFLIALAAAKLLERHDPRRFASLTQGMFQNSITTFGVPSVGAAYGAGSTGIVSMITALLVPIKNVVVVCHMSAVCGRKKTPGALVLNIAGNPFFVAGVLGFSAKLFSLRLPYVAEQTVSALARAATPLSLLLLGASLSFKSMKSYKRDILWGVLMKMLLLPAALTPFAVLSGLRGPALLSVLILLAAPSATSAHITAREMGADSELASHLTVVSAAVSALTLFLFIFI